MVSVTVETGPLRIRAVFTGGTGKQETRTFTEKYIVIVEAVGKDVTEFQLGDEVFGSRSGTLAEYVCGLERNFAPRPVNVSFEEAAAIPVAGFTVSIVRPLATAKPGRGTSGSGGLRVKRAYSSASHRARMFMRQSR